MKIRAKEAKPRATRIAFIALCVVLGALAALMFVSYVLFHTLTPTAQNWASVLTRSDEKPQWTMVASQKLVDSSFQYVTYKEFPPLKKFPRPPNEKFRYYIEGRWAAENPQARLFFFDDENYRRWVKREPPIPLAAFEPGQPVKVYFSEMPGMVVVEPPPQAPHMDLSSISAALLSFIQMQSAQQVPASQATLDLRVVTEAFITPSVAARMRK